jgi:glycosyltransferase involved in cell wall biosynthesis
MPNGTAMKSSSRPLISVVIPCYNQGQFLGDAVDSVLGQTYSRVEAIVVDDGATDHTPQVAMSYGDRIRYVRKENAGLPAARNTGILEAEGEYVLFLDADDYLAPEMLERVMEAADRSPTGAVFHGGWKYVNIAGIVFHQNPPQPIDADPFHALLAGYCPPCHSLVVPRGALADVGLFDVGLRMNEDWDMWLRLAAAGHPFVGVPDSISVYRRYAGSMSTNSERLCQSGIAVLEKCRAYHRDCARCRKIIAGGIRHWREAAFRGMLEELSGRRGPGRKTVGLITAGQSVLRSPSLLRVFLRC